MPFKLTTICVIDSIINTKETNNFTVIEANAVARVEKNNNNKNGIFNINLTAFYNKNSSIPSFVDELVEGAIYEISGKANLIEFSKANEIKIILVSAKRTKISTQNLHISALNIYLTGMMSKIKKTNEVCYIEIKVKEWVKGVEDNEYQINCRFLNIDQRLCNKTNNLNENSHLLVCGELTVDRDSQIIVDILDINYLPGYQQKTPVKSTTQLSTTYNWEDSEESNRKSISKIINKEIINLDNEENFDNNNEDDNNKNDIIVIKTKENDDDDIVDVDVDVDVAAVATTSRPKKNNKRKGSNKTSNNTKKKIVTRQSKKNEKNEKNDEYEFY